MLYLSNPPTGKASTIQFFKQQKLNLGATKMQDVLAKGIPHHHQIAYAVYKESLPAFLRATVSQKRLLNNPKEYYPFPIVDSIRTLPLGIPPISVAPPKPEKGVMSQTEMDDWKRSVAGLSEVPNGKSTCYVIMKPIRGALKDLYNSCSPSASCPDGTVSLASIGSYFTCWKILMAFLATHTYPAFQEKEGTQDVVFSYEADGEFIFKAVDTAFDMGQTKKRGLDALAYALARPANRRRVAAETKEDVDLEFFDTDAWQEEHGYEVNRDSVETSYQFESVVPIAKPAPLRPEINFGPSRVIPNMSGIACPYFEGMVLQDTMTVPQIISRYFFRNLGDDREDAADTLQKIKSGYMLWGKSKQGKEMAHIFKCLTLALEAQARLYVCIDNDVYTGCALIGEQFSVAMNGVIYDVEPALDMYAAFATVNSHEDSVNKLVEFIKSQPLRDDMAKPIETDGEVFPTMRSLARLASFYKVPIIPKRAVAEAGSEDEPIQSVEYNEIKDKVIAMERAFSRLVFKQEYLKATPDAYLQAVNDIKAHRLPLTSAPMYCPSVQELFRCEVTFLVLSQFGSTAPSFFNRGGQAVKFDGLKQVSITSADGMITWGECPITPYPFGAILMSQKSLVAAVEDTQEMMKKKYIMQDPKERAKAARNLAYEGLTLDRIWTGLNRTLIGLKGADAPGEKRARVLTESEKAAEQAKAAKRAKKDLADF